MSPKTAPDAPTVKWLGSISITPKAPPSRDTKYTSSEAAPAEGRLQQLAQPVEDEHVEADVDEVGVEEAARHERYHSPVATPICCPVNGLKPEPEQAAVEITTVAGSGGRRRCRRRRCRG